ncbi:MAG: hypothetical protein ACRC28_06470 [Clostridium sp.]|uniref:hypothetical protein n=1 Tax=Clostridium sp. TaxID=1506 RepID=UPI003F3F4CA0
MPLSSTDLNITFSKITGESIPSCVVGKTAQFKLSIKNLNLTDPIYNLNCFLKLPDGMSFTTASVISNSIDVDSSFNTNVSFFNLTDLYPNSQSFDLILTLKIDNNFKSNNSLVPYNYLFSNISILIKGDSKPRGTFDSGNTVISKTSYTTITSIRYSAKITYPGKTLKGAGTTSSENATNPFTISIQIENTERESSNLSFILNLANGIRYLGAFSSTGSNASNFTNPIITTPTSVTNITSLSLNNKTLSANGIVTLSFQAAIYDKYTLNGIENSGSLIEENASLLSTFNLTGSLSSYYTEFSIQSSSVIINHSCSSNYTDVNSVNEYILTYVISEYSSISDAIFTFSIPNGMSYISSTLTPNSTTIVDLNTILTFNYSSLSQNSEGFIKVYTTTENEYALSEGEIDTKYVYSTDIFTTAFTFNGGIISSSENASLSSLVSITCEPPLLTTDVVAYLNSDSSIKSYDAASTGDYIRFNLHYNANTVSAKQKDVLIFDYPPLNLSVLTVKNIQITGDFPSSGTYVTIPDNGTKILVGNLDGGVEFEFKFDLLVGPEFNDGFLYNLAKCSLVNSQNQSYSTRDSSLLNFGIPHIHLANTVPNSKCLKYTDTLAYEIVISNDSADDTNILVDGYNLKVLSTIPSLFTFNNLNLSSSLGSTIAYNVTNNILNISIPKLPPYEVLTITNNLTIDTVPILGMDYDLTLSCSNGTSQQALDSYIYSFNEFPLNALLTLTACKPTLTKTYVNSTVRLFEEFSVFITVTFPRGCLCYNAKIKDSLNSTNSSNVHDVYLNGTPTIPVISTNNFNLPLGDTIDSSLNTVSYTLTYKDKIVSANLVNYEKSSTVTTSIDWSDVLYAPENYAKSLNRTLLIVAPGLILNKFQANPTEGFNLSKFPIFSSYLDTITYSIVVSNIGKSSAYNVNIVDTLPSYLTFVNMDFTGSFDNTSNKYSLNLAELTKDSTLTVTLNSFLNQTLPSLGMDNIAYSNYSNLNNSDTLTTETLSNVVIAYPEASMEILSKYQRNLTTEGIFTKNMIKCSSTNIVEYKLIIKNDTNKEMQNIHITDIFSSKFNFYDSDTLPLGNFSVDNNILSISIPSMNPSTTITFIYRIILLSPFVGIESSVATGEFNYEDDITVFECSSSPLLIKLSNPGRGFSFY